MHGLGNDFMLLDCRTSPFNLTEAQMRALGDRKTGVGFDQLLVIEDSCPEVDALQKLLLDEKDGSSRLVVPFFLICNSLPQMRDTFSLTSGGVKVKILRRGTLTPLPILRFRLM